MTIREENVHDRDPVRQGHVSVFHFTPFAIASESLASQLCLPTALTHGRFASSLSVSVSVSLSVSVCVPVMPLRMCPRRRLISPSPRYLLTWQCRRLSTVFTPHL